MPHPDDQLQEAVCQEHHCHGSAIENVETSMPDDDTLIDTSEFFKTLSDSSRLKIIAALLTGELCVCDICEIVGLSQSAVSHQLRVLRAGRIVKFRKDGKQVFYSIDDLHIAEIIQTAIQHLRESD